MKAFQDKLTTLEAADTQVLGVSMDSPFSNFHFGQQNGITFPLLGDWGGEVTKKYGLAKQYDIQGAKLESARRATFVIDKDGKIIHIEEGNAAIDPTGATDACSRSAHKAGQ